GPVHVERQPDDEPRRLVRSDHRGDGFEVTLSTDPPHDPDAADRQLELVAHGDADPRVPDVERGQSHEDVVTSGTPNGQSRLENRRRACAFVDFRESIWQGAPTADTSPSASRPPARRVGGPTDDVEMPKPRRGIAMWNSAARGARVRGSHLRSFAGVSQTMEERRERR